MNRSFPFPRSLTDAEKIERLERIWSRTGPLRPITFEFRVCESEWALELDPDYDYRASAAKIVSFAESNGFSVKTWSDGGDITIEVTKLLSPTLTEINQWVEVCRSKADCDGIYFDGWRYPKPLEICFWLENGNAHRIANAEKHALRTKAIFEEVVIQDPLNRASEEEFTLSKEAFFRRAQKLKPHNPQATVSAYSQWVYSLYSDSAGVEEDREAGRRTEEAVWELRRRAERSLDANTLRKSYADWHLIHNGLHVHEASRSEYLRIPSLRVGGRPLAASPDMAFRNRANGKVIIVEIKSSFMTLPVNLWPNVWAQLWCYSNLEFAFKAPEVTVVAEVWANCTSYRGGSTAVALRASVRRDPRKQSFDSFFRKLFDIYCGA